MKNKIKVSLFFTMAVLSIAAYSQPTNKMNYQAVARDASGAILSSQTLGVLISIENGSGGPVLYSERHVPVTNQFGLFTLQVGGGTLVSGNYNTINWSNGNQW